MLSQMSRLSPQTPLNVPPRSNYEHSQTQKNDTISDYEQTREERIKQNLQKMQKLGIFDLSLKVNSNIHQTRAPKNHSRLKSSPATPPSRPSGPSRRSSRLKSTTPVNYSELDLTKKDKALEDGCILTEKGFRPEIYTEEHEKLLGHTEKSWTLFVDGCGKDGKRIYDQFNGKTCHQCRQKTLGHRTHCSECNKVQGQFCGDCLYMRYGEHVLEAKENPDWVCPVCRGICNCSLCRQAKGWPPTGTLYRKISQLGYKSVAHYLIQTCRVETNLGNNEGATTEVPAKRSLPFSDMNEVPNEVNSDQLVSSKQFNDKSTDEFSVKRSLPFSNLDMASDSVSSLEVADQIGCSNHQYPIKREVCSDTALKSSSKLQKEEPAQDLAVAEEKVMTLEKISLEKEVDQENDVEFTCDKHDDPEKTLLVRTPLAKEISPFTRINSDSIAGRLKRRQEKSCDCDDEKKANVMQTVEGISLPSDIIKQAGDSNAPLETSRKLKAKRAVAVEPSPDSIAGRLRQRRRMDNGISC
ncbi:uncharacterized protein LOC115712051 [Cannabis sativa]|uniref:uncharacterized protein LOC115712051 n=1 Tax=Cannabis sativa TaxID=3483 RepID=UPI0029C9D7BF|nr:uncharacterized protein LOC115712051 [Cannabis sativa]